MSSPMFVAGAPGASSASPTFGVSGDYDPKISEEVDRQIRNMPGIVQHCYNKAREVLAGTGSQNFEVILSHSSGQSRPRAYVCPSNDDGIHEELSQAVLLKAAMGMAGR